MKKLTALIIALLIALGAVALTSCGGETEDSETNDMNDIDYETVNNEGWSPSFKP